MFERIVQWGMRECIIKSAVKRIFGNIWKRERYLEKIMIWNTKVYDKMYDLTIREKIFFFYAWNVIWKDSDAIAKFLIKRVIDLENLYSGNSMIFYRQYLGDGNFRN